MDKKLKKLLEFIENQGKKVRKSTSSKSAISDCDKDIKIVADMKLNNKITSYLENNFNYEILSEEGIHSKSFLNYEKPIWIIDPLDGSLNFNRGIPHYCISISLWNQSESLFGCIFDISNSDMYVSYDNKSTLNNKNITDTKPKIVITKK